MNLLSENKRGIIILEPLIMEEAKKNYIENVGRPKSDKLAQNSAPIKPIETRNELAKIAGVSRKEPNGNYRRFKPYLLYCKRFIL